ncbi:hypothetical protein [Microbacterium sp. 179-I 3D3 NHS]|uniref:hypothetical protein n=1 Tax=Microbacterium sp. 179-I 3D3 NHS TaxID=3142382 RepID=UPI0039A35267
MNKKKMNAEIDRALAEKIQLLVNDPDFPAEESLHELGPKEVVRRIWRLNGWGPEEQPWGLLQLYVADEIRKFAEYIMENDGAPVCYMVLREFAMGFWDRKHALANSLEEPMFFRFHTYAALFGMGTPMLQAITEEALEMVECTDSVEIDYRFWQLTQGLAA